MIMGILVAMLQYEVLNPIPIEVINIGGKLATVCVAIFIVMALLLQRTKYWSRYVSDMIDMNTNSLLPLFFAMVISKIISLML